MNEIAFRKILVERFGGPDVLRTVRATLPAPAPAPGYARVGTASAPGARQALARNGVEFIDHRHEDSEAVLNDREPGGVQAVFDHVGGPALRKGYRVLAPGGVLVSYAASGQRPRNPHDARTGRRTGGWER
ncbi:zinc-binding dehydrogenase [Streptomyces noursei]|uniref:zinc-binding dehydrogenase n=1 Tax=Streptomyces noursei TaxID=1971 RepID=UPI0035D5452E